MSATRFPSGFYGIIDTGFLSTAIAVGNTVQCFLDAGVSWIQLRAKDLPSDQLVETAKAIKAQCRGYNARVIINDRVDVALAVNAHGVHLGQDDLKAADARKLLGENAVIGVSTHTVAQVVKESDAQVADYLGFGPVFSTQSKSNAENPVGLRGLAEACRRSALPIVAIGGISLESCREVRESGAAAVAMISSVLTDDVGDTVPLAVARCS
jgi:thiamine-phosphate pyrophosphorylase